MPWIVASPKNEDDVLQRQRIGLASIWILPITVPELALLPMTFDRKNQRKDEIGARHPGK
jgi:hypothetical protein